MEPAEDRRYDGKSAWIVAGSPFLPQWSLLGVGGTASNGTLYMIAESRPQWSPPGIGGTTDDLLAAHRHIERVAMKPTAA